MFRHRKDPLDSPQPPPSTYEELKLPVYGPLATMSGDIWAYSEFINFPGGRPLQRQGVEGGEEESNYGHAAVGRGVERRREEERTKEAIKSLSEHN